VVVLGTIAFAVTEGVSVAHGFVWTLDTVTTLGALQDPQGVTGRVVVVLLELFGIGTLFYGLATVAEFFVSGQLSGLREERRNQRMIDAYSDHFIICGFGRVGRQVARDLGLAGARHVAIDANPSHRDEAAELGVRYIESYAADDEVLIIARASAEDAERKLQRAGADRVISPYKTSGSEMARLALHPQVGGALKLADYRMDQIEVCDACEGVGQTVEQVRGEAVVVAVRHPDGRLEPQPPPSMTIEAGQLLVAIGTPEALERLETMFQPVAVPSA
jgi:voltage-gated potassium channel